MAAQSKSKGGKGFESFAIHSTDSNGKKTFAKLEAERGDLASFSLESSQPARLDPESAAKRILQQALESPAVAGLTAPKVDKIESEFKSLGVTTVPLTGTNVVKFRQYVKGVPVYGSLVSVELGDSNEAISLNSNLAKPDVKTSVAKVSPQEALKTVAKRAGYGRQLPSSPPELNYYWTPRVSGIWPTSSRTCGLRKPPNRPTSGLSDQPRQSRSSTIT